MQYIQNLYQFVAESRANRERVKRSRQAQQNTAIQRQQRQEQVPISSDRVGGSIRSRQFAPTLTLGTAPGDNDNERLVNDECPREHALLPPNMTTLERRWRLSLYNALQQHGAKMLWRDVCDLSDVFKPGTMRIEKKDSASTSIILVGQLSPPSISRFANDTNLPTVNDQNQRQPTAEQVQRLQRVWDRIKCDIVIKLSMPKLYEDYSPGYTSSLESEVILYRFAGQLVDLNVTPNLVLGLEHWICSYGALRAGRDAAMLSVVQEAIETTYKEEKMKLAPYDQIRFLVLERGRGKPMNDVLPSLTEDSLLSIVFQLLYTLDCLNRRFIRHADLHLFNVFVDRLSDSKTRLAYIPYLVDSESDLWFDVPTYGYVPKIYDWDRGGIYFPKDSTDRVPAWPMPDAELLNGVSNDLCAQHSACEKNSKADAFTILTTLYDNSSTNEFSRFRGFVERSIDYRLLAISMTNDDDGKSEIERRGGHAYRMCGGVLDETNCDDLDADLLIKKGNCSQAWEPSDCMMHTPAQMMLDEVFAEYRRDARSPQTLPWNTTPYVFGDWPSRAEYELIKTAQNSAARPQPIRRKRGVREFGN